MAIFKSDRKTMQIVKFASRTSKTKTERKKENIDIFQHDSWQNHVFKATFAKRHKTKAYILCHQ